MQIALEAEDRHDFGGDADIEAGLARKAVAVPQTRNDVAQRTVVHVHHAAPGDAARVDAKAIAPVDVVVDQGREKIVGRGNGMEIAREMEVDVLHGDNLCITSTRRTALHAEAWAKRRLTHADDGLATDTIERIAKADRGGRLPLACRRRVDRRDEDKPAIRLVLQRSDEVARELGLVMAEGKQVFLRNIELCANLLDWLPGRLTGDLDVGFHLSHPALLLSIQNLTQLDKVRAGAKDIETHCCQMGRHNPTGLAAIGDDEGRDVQGRAELLLGIVPQRVERTLGNHVTEISASSVQQAVITIELAIGEPEAVIGAEVEPAAIMVFGPLAQDRGGGANVASDAIQELHQVVGAGVEYGIATLQAGIEVAQRLARCAIERRRRRFGAKWVQTEIPGIFTELDILARPLEVAIDLRRAAYTTERIDQFDRGTTDCLIHAALE